MIIIAGYRAACDAAVKALEARAFDNSGDGAAPDALRADLINIARTTLSSKILTVDKEHFAKIAVDAVMCLKGRTNLEAVHVIKKAGGTLKESFLAEVRGRLAGYSAPAAVAPALRRPRGTRPAIRLAASADHAAPLLEPSVLQLLS